MKKKKVLALCAVALFLACINFDEAYDNCTAEGGNCTAGSGGGGGGAGDAGGGGEGGGAADAPLGAVRTPDGGLFRLLCSDGGFCLEHPLGSVEELRGVSPTDAGALWAVGLQGTLLHFDGAAWSTFHTPRVPIEDVTQDPDGTVHFVGAGVTGKLTPDSGLTWRSDCPDCAFRRVWSDGIRQVAAGTDEGLSFPRLYESADGGAYTKVPLTFDGGTFIFGIAGSWDDLWVMGNVGGAHRTGSGWENDDSIPRRSWQGTCLLQGQPVATSFSGLITHRSDGATWPVTRFLPASQQSRGIECEPSRFVFTDYSKLHLCLNATDAGSCSESVGTAAAHITDLERVGTDFVYVTRRGHVQRMDGNTTDMFFIAPASPRAAVKGLRRNPVSGQAWAVGDDQLVLRETANGWEGSAPNGTLILNDIDFDETGRGWVAREDGRLTPIPTGATSININVAITPTGLNGSPNTVPLPAVNALSHSNARFIAAGADDRVLQSQPDGGWTTIYSGGTTAAYHAAWAAPDGTVVVVGDNGKIVILPVDGGSPQAIATTLTQPALETVWGASSQRFYVGGAGADLYRVDNGTTFTKLDAGTGNREIRIQSIAGQSEADAFMLYTDSSGRSYVARGPPGTWDHATAERLSTIPMKSLLVEPNSVFVYGQNGAIFRLKR